jgi:hypothetical protein
MTTIKMKSVWKVDRIHVFKEFFIQVNTYLYHDGHMYSWIKNAQFKKSESNFILTLWKQNKKYNKNNNLI